MLSRRWKLLGLTALEALTSSQTVSLHAADNLGWSINGSARLRVLLQLSGSLAREQS